MRIGPKTKVSIGYATLGRDRGGFHDDKTRTTHRARTQMNKMPVRGKTLMTTVLAHRRNPDAIAQGDASHFQGFKEMTHAWAPRL
jgi:hypothetical protein